ncbi:hypothetical protein BJX66DRAFT_299554 [Aspergillus keveii]|uniref:Uncharacterized protein n=1 Tax=Aspergillus keveii TaxID=714993 RepID=A0ABR4GC76_9EURO
MSFSRSTSTQASYALRLSVGIPPQGAGISLPEGFGKVSVAIPCSGKFYPFRFGGKLVGPWTPIVTRRMTATSVARLLNV